MKTFPLSLYICVLFLQIHSAVFAQTPDNAISQTQTQAQDNSPTQPPEVNWGTDPNQSTPSTKVYQSQQLPRLKVHWNCGQCEKDPFVDYLIADYYIKEGLDKGYSFSSTETADVVINEYLLHNMGLRFVAGIWAGKDRLNTTISFRGKLFQANTFNAGNLNGKDRICKAVAKIGLSHIISALSLPIKPGYAQQSVAMNSSVMPAIAESASGRKETIFLISPVERLDMNKARFPTKDECRLPNVVESGILELANSAHYPIKSISPYKRKGTAMSVSIIDIDGAGSGGKSIKMHVDLLKDGDIVAGKDFEPQANDGATSGSCEVLEKLAKSYSTLSVKWAVEQANH